MMMTIYSRSSKTLLEKLIAERGDKLLVTPKFHPEFAAIEAVYRDVSKEVRRTNTPGVSKG